MIVVTILLSTCVNCAGTLALKKLAEDEGLDVVLEIVEGSDDRTRKTAELGLGLPVLVREDGALSNDAKTWSNVDKLADESTNKHRRSKKTSPVDDVVEIGVEDAIPG